MFKSFILGLLLLTFSTFTLAHDDAPHQEIDIVANVSVEDEPLSKYELYLIFTMKMRTWSGGGKISVVIFETDSQTHRKFLNEILGINTLYYNRLLRSKRRTDFEIVDSHLKLFTIISSTPGSIGYAEGAIVVNKGDNSIKVIKIDG